MKSVFQEASSLGSAIEKAWEAVGSPEGFEVKILKAGERNFFGFCKVPYAVCVTAVNKAASGCDPKPRSIGNRMNASLSENSEESQAGRNLGKDWSSSSRRDSRQPREKEVNGRSSFARKNERPFGTSVSRERPAETAVDEVSSLRPLQSGVALEVDHWTDDNAKRAEAFLSSILTILGLADFSLKSALENNFLRMSVSCAEGNELLEKSFFICIAPLIVQMVKKSTGEHLRGLRIVISQA